ncbi:energy transducer TonB [uncultured Sphingomonas sp.]|uniref:energy transducer TonB n=1 Tax=uncultured Sphingomonas sp. TaxID=158754 RepID=UPI0025E3B8F7|nr:energy transducer TonB [uncultured Sphingomonas sp.]
MPSEAGPSGYRQPVQARAFGTGAMVATGLLGIVLLSIRVTTPPTPVADAGSMAVFVAEAIPLDRPVLDPAEPPPAPPPPDATPPRPTAALPSTMAPAASVIAAPSSVGPPSAAPLAQPADAVALPSSPSSGTKPVESPATTAPAASAAAAAADWRARLLGHLKHYRRYPRQAEAARQQGVARIAITLHRSGEVIAVELVHGSGYPLLDMEARTTVRRAAPLPAVDDAVPGDPVTVEVPIEFALHR